MKKLLILFVLIFNIYGFHSVYAYDFEADGIYYIITDNTAKEVAVTYKSTSYNSYSGVINIPSTTVYNGETYSVTSIGKNAFFDCNNLIAVTIPNSVREIGKWAFADCINIKSVTIGSGVMNIENNAFSYKIPKVIWLGNTPPIGCDKVQAQVHYVSNYNFTMPASLTYPFLSSRFEVDNVVYVPVSISERTCEVIDCNYNPTSTEIVIDSIVKNKDIALKVLDINDYSFYRNDSITRLVINNDGDIGGLAFSNCDALTSVIANNNGDIKGSAFYNCDVLTSVIANNNGKIELLSFSECKNLNTLYLGKEITEIETNAFYCDISLQEIVLPDNISKLGFGTFSGCSSLNQVSIGRGLYELPSSTFSFCTSLDSLTIPANILYVGNFAFEGCTSLSNISFLQPNKESLNKKTVTFADWSATDSSSQTYIIDVNAGDVLSFEIWSESEYGDIVVFINDNYVENIRGPYNSKIITKYFSEPQTISLQVWYYIKESVIGKAGIRNIALNDHTPIPITLGFNGLSTPLFSDCPLDEVFIGRKLAYKLSAEYGNSPFHRNSSLRSVKISDSEDTIYDNEFYGCSNLQEFECGDGVTSIGNWAFSGCSSLRSYLSGTSVKTIGQEAFSDCTALTSFISNAVVPPVCGNQALDDINKWECTLYVPKESIDDYQTTDQWKEFFFIDESGVEDVIVDREDTTSYPVEIYNLSGTKIGNSTDFLTPGIYIKCQGRKVEKIMVK